jgi:hypothetical protein
MQSAPEPLSWLTLERYALGELSADERAEVEARLAASESDRACLAEILADKSELPPLTGLPEEDAPSAQVAAPASLAAARARQKAHWLPWSLGLCAAAAALLLVLRKPSGEQASDPALLADHVKGTDVTLRLHSDRSGSDPSRFSAGERFKLEVTCPPSLSDVLRLVIVQGSELFEPLPRSPSFRCGNLAAWPGAFALDGTEAADVCVYWGSSERPSKEDLARAGTCTRLSPP